MCDKDWYKIRMIEKIQKDDDAVQTDYFGVFTYSFSEAMLFSILLMVHEKGSYHSRNCNFQYVNWVQKALLQIKLPQNTGKSIHWYNQYEKIKTSHTNYR